MNRSSITVCHVFAFFFQICITCYPLIRTINFGKYLRLFQIKPIKTLEFRFMQIEKRRQKRDIINVSLYSIVDTFCNPLLRLGVNINSDGYKKS